MIEHLADKPSGDSVTAWLSNIAQTSDVNSHYVQDENLNLNGLPALKVRYRTADGGLMETVYVVAGRLTFAVIFGDGDGSDAVLERRRNYPTYQKMLHTFRNKPVNER